MARIKAQSDIKERWQFDQLIDDLVDKQIVMERLVLRRDKKLLDVRSEFDPDINDLSDAIQANLIRAEKYAAEHRDELLPDKKKTAETTLAFFGWRIGNKTLVLLNRKWSWKKVISAIETAGWVKFIKTKKTVDKDAVKDNCTDEQRAAIGTRIEQKETFFVDPKRDPSDPQRLVTGKLTPPVAANAETKS